ncbi:MAG: hypothetical protein QNK19_01360 [Xanthomonadales bacterium]|nr:hypothetical protein [Xanthomonadales bacterium]
MKNGQTQLVSIEAHRLAKTLIWVAVALAIAHIVCMFGWYKDWLPVDDWRYIAFFDLDEEESLGTWFSTLILLLAGLLSFIQAKYSDGGHNRWHFCWWLLGIGFCILSLDEVAGFHEFVNTMVEGTHWTTFGAGLVLVMGIVFLPFWLSLPKRTRVLFLIAGAIYVGGAVGVEWGTIWHEDHGELDTLGYNLWNALEEFMEMAGIVLYIYAISAHIEACRQGARLELVFGRSDLSQ